MCFPVNFSKILRTLNLQNICEQLLLFIIYQVNKRGVSVSCFLGKGFLIIKYHRNEAKHGKGNIKRGFTVTCDFKNSEKFAEDFTSLHFLWVYNLTK